MGHNRLDWKIRVSWHGRTMADEKDCSQLHYGTQLQSERLCLMFFRTWWSYGSRTRATYSGKQSFRHVLKSHVHWSYSLPLKSKSCGSRWRGAFIPVWMMHTDSLTSIVSVSNLHSANRDAWCPLLTTSICQRNNCCSLFYTKKNTYHEQLTKREWPATSNRHDSSGDEGQGHLINPTWFHPNWSPWWTKEPLLKNAAKTRHLLFSSLYDRKGPSPRPVVLAKTVANRKPERRSCVVVLTFEVNEWFFVIRCISSEPSKSLTLRIPLRGRFTSLAACKASCQNHPELFVCDTWSETCNYQSGCFSLAGTVPSRHAFFAILASPRNIIASEL